MLIHIVRHNERIEDIIDAYQVSFDDIKVNNLHITDFKKLQGGLKIKIPFLSNESKQILEASESFISDYYPSLEKIDSVLKNIESSSEMTEEEDLFDKKISNDILSNKKDEDDFSAIDDIKKNTESQLAFIEQKEVERQYIRPQYGIPVPSKPKSIYPYYINKNKKNESK